MSVRTGDRSEGKLAVLNEIRKLGEYTIQVCRSEKVFPKSSRWVMAKPIIDECLGALTCVRRANAVYVEKEHIEKYADAYCERRNEQVKAHSHLDAMLSLIDLAYTSFDIESSRIEYWTGLVKEGTTKESLRAWFANAKRGDTFFKRTRMSHYYYELKGRMHDGYQRISAACQNRGCMQSASWRNG